MNSKILALSMIALLPTLAVVPASNAETVDAVCASVTVLTGSDLSSSYSGTACGPAIGWALVRNPTDSTVAWTITTDSGSVSCVWPAGAGSSCSGGAPPASIGSTYTVTVTSTSGDVVMMTHATATV